MNKLIAVLLTLICCTWVPPGEAAAASADAHTLLRQAVGGAWRSDANRLRDPYRHPIATLEFFGLRPDMTVVELRPDGGWYTEILAPVLRDNGQLIAATANLAGADAKKLSGNPAVFGKVKLSQFSPPEHVSMGEGRGRIR